MNDVSVFQSVHDSDLELPSLDHLVGQLFAQFALFDGDVRAIVLVNVMQDLAKSARPQRHWIGAPTARVERHDWFDVNGFLLTGDGGFFFGIMYINEI